VILYARASRHRRPQFQMSTTIERLDGRMIVRKRALVPEAQPEVAGLPGKAREIARALQPHVTVSGVKLEDGTAVSEFVEGKNLATLFEGALVSRDTERVIELCEKIVKLMDTLPTHEEEYDPGHPLARVFGDSFVGKHQAVDLGYIDYNLDNFIQTEGGLVLVDPEWTFDFAIPKEFLVKRFFYSFFSKYSNLIAYLAGEQLPVVEPARDLFIPEPVFETFRDRIIPLDKTIESDRCFQEHVSLYRDLEPIPVYGEPKRHTAPVIQLSIGRRQAIIQALEQELDAYKLRTMQAEGRLNELKSTKAWKVAAFGNRTLRRVQGSLKARGRRRPE
jgi:hypothetical protein